MDKQHKKQIRRYVAWGCAAAVVVLLAVMPLLAAPKTSEDGPKASILSARAEQRDITRRLLGGGTLYSAEKMDLTIPREVKLKSFLVGNGDVVSEGDPIAVVDRVSVMTAITQVQETLDYLAKEIQTASTETVSEYVKAGTGGTVKHIYAENGDDVEDVMLEHGALAVLSLDGLMAVEIECSTKLSSGDLVGVILSDGTKEKGTVRSNLEGTLVVTVEDDNYAPGEMVEVTMEDGSAIGTGELYIYSPWTAHGYTGTVFSVLVKEGQKVYSGQTLFSLKETGDTSDYQKLINQRREYEEMMQELFRMYSSEVITAPCDGIVSGVDKDGAYMLSVTGKYTLSGLTNLVSDQPSGYAGYIARVLSAGQNSLDLLADPQIQTVYALGDLRVNAYSMTERWNYTGATHVYTRTADGLLTPDGSAQEGDLLLFLGDAQSIRWIIRLENAGANSTAASDSYRVVLLADGENGENGGEGGSSEGGTGGPSEGGDGGASEGGEGGPPEGGEGGEGGDGPEQGETKVCDKTEDCDADTHEPGCPHYQDPTVQYSGYVAVVESVGDGFVSLKKSAVAIAVSSFSELKIDSASLTEPGTYGAVTYADGSAISVGDKVFLLDSGGIMKIGGSGGGQLPGGMAGLEAFAGLGGFGGGMGGGAAVPAFEPYSLDEVTVATVTSQETMLLDIMVDEADVLQLRKGQSAQLSVDALGGQSFEATITEISGSGTNSGGRTKFTVTAATDKHENMYPGMTGSLAVEIEAAQNVVVLPVAALVEEGTAVFVYTGYDEKEETLLKPVAVTTGVSDGEYVQVFGIDENTQVFYAYYDTLVHSLTPETGFSR